VPGPAAKEKACTVFLFLIKEISRMNTTMCRNPVYDKRTCHHIKQGDTAIDTLFL